MATKDLHNSVHIIQGIYPQVLAAAKVADNAADFSTGGIAGGVAGSGPCESAEVVFTIGAATGTLTPVIEESDDNSSYTAVAAADLLGGALPAGFSATDQNSVVKRGYRGVKRYLRARFSAGTASIAVGVTIVLSHPRRLPMPSTL